MASLEEYFNQDALVENFESLKKSHWNVIADKPEISVGSDHLGLSQFERERDLHIRAIERKVIQGRYTFSPFLECEIVKPESKDLRTISVGTIRDTIVQRGIYQYLYGRIDSLMEDSIFAYRRQKYTHGAIRLIQRHFANGFTFVFDADLTRFFDNVVHQDLMEKLTSLDRVDDRVVKLVYRFLKTGGIPQAQVLEHKNHIGGRRKFSPEPRLRGVPQGGVLSGMLSNLYLAEFDKAILGDFPGYVRYADDFVICCKSEAQCRTLKAKVTKLLPAGTTLNYEKTTECVDAERGIDFLGFRVSKSRLRVRGRNVQRLKSRLSKVIEQQRVYPKWSDTLDRLVSRLRFKIQGPMHEQLQTLANFGYSVSLYQRSWIGFFRIVDDIEQIRNIDHWLRSQISSFMWKVHKKKVTMKMLQNFDMPTLVNTQFRARRSQPLAPLPEEIKPS